MARLHGHWLKAEPITVQPESACILLIHVHLGKPVSFLSEAKLNIRPGRLALDLVRAGRARLVSRVRARMHVTRDAGRYTDR